MIDTPPPSSETLAALAEQLRDDDGIVRQAARKQLLRAGTAATAIFVQALEDESRQTRWEGAKGLSRLGDPAASTLLVEHLRDEDPGIRWLAAEGLIRTGSACLRPLLTALTTDLGDESLLEGAHHILHELLQHPAWSVTLEPVWDALNGDYASRLRVPLAAREALAQIA